MERDVKKGGTLDRRRLLKAGLLGGGSAVVAAALAGCGETQVVEIVKEVPVEKVVTQIVEKAVVEEKVVTQIVEKQVVVEKVVTEAPAMRRSGTVTYWSWWAPTLRLAFGAWDEFLRTDFEKNNPGLKAEVQFLPFGDLVTKTIASLAGGEAPDALHASVAFARDLYDKGALISMNDHIKVQPEYGMDNYFEGSTFFNQYKGQVFGIPGEGPEFTARAYNTEHFDAAGLASDPQEVQQWTSEMWVEAALKLTQRDGDKVTRSGWVAINQSEESWAANSYANGVPNLYIDEGKALHPDLPARGAEVLQYEYDMLHVHNVSKPITPDRTDRPDFYRGEASALYMGSGNIGEINQQQPDLPFEMVQMPRYPNWTDRQGVTWTNMMTVPTKGDNDLGFEFAAWYGSLDAAIGRVRINNIPSARKDFYDTEGWAFLKRAQPQWGSFYEGLRPMDNAGPWPYIRRGCLSQVIRPLGQAVMLGDKTPDEAVAEIFDASIECLEDVP